MLGAGGAGARLQTGSKGISPEMSLLVLNPVSPLQICFAESNYCRAGSQGSEETLLHLGERVQVPDLGPLGLQRLCSI